MKTILVDAFLTLITEEGEIFEGMYDLLESFANKKIVLTGANDEEFKKYGLDKLPYEVFSLKHTPDKIDPKYYGKMLDHFGLSAGETVYVEHDPGAVNSATSIGIKTYFYDSEKKDLVALKSFLTDNL